MSYPACIVVGGSRAIRAEGHNIQVGKGCVRAPNTAVMNASTSLQTFLTGTSHANDDQGVTTCGTNTNSPPP